MIWPRYLNDQFQARFSCVHVLEDAPFRPVQMTRVFVSSCTVKVATYIIEIDFCFLPFKFLPRRVVFDSSLRS